MYVVVRRHAIQESILTDWALRHRVTEGMRECEREGVSEKANGSSRIGPLVTSAE